MEFFKIRKDIPFMRYALYFNIISLVTFLLAVLFLVTKGLHFSIEFTGGTLIEVTTAQPADLDKMRGALEKAGYTDTTVQTFGTSRDILIRMPLKPGQKSEALGAEVVKTLQGADATVEKRRVEFIGPQVGRELYENGALALLVTSLGIDSARRDHHPRLLCALSVGVLLAGARGGARRARLFGKRIGGDRRSYSREFSQDAQSPGRGNH